MKKKIEFCGVKFYDFVDRNDVKTLLNSKLFLVAPSGPGLSSIDKDPTYHNSISNSNYAILDSGFFCILINLFTPFKVKKLSGYKFLILFLNVVKDIDNFVILSIDPDNKRSINNKKFLKKMGIKSKHYVAPIYNNTYYDHELLDFINKNPCDAILINIAGGVQEKLGFELNKNIKYNIPIFCFGAAISFLNGDQAKVTDFYDKYYLGWFIRCISNPNFLVRYIKSFKLIYIFFKHYKKIKYYD